MSVARGRRLVVDVIIPALNEAGAIGDVIQAIPRPPVREVVVVDNGSVDRTADHARAAGARVVVEPRRGYGAACLAGLAALAPDTDVVVFLDADGSDDPAVLPSVIEPIEAGRADLVIGARTGAAIERGSLTPQQRFGNVLAAGWLRLRFGLPATDLGPFRAIRATSLAAIGMTDRDYGWTVEMQIKAARRRLRYAEVNVPYRRRRHGSSKVSGTLRGTVGAAIKILGLLAWHDLVEPRLPGRDHARGLTPRITETDP